MVFQPLHGGRTLTNLIRENTWGCCDKRTKVSQGTVKGMRRRKCEGPKRMRIVALPVTLWSEEMAERVQREGREWLKLLEAVDWERYKKRVAQAVKRAVQKFRREHPDEPVFTISILTDPRFQWTCISFDTKEHVYEQVRSWREEGYEEDDAKETAKGKAEVERFQPLSSWHCVFEGAQKPVVTIETAPHPYRLLFP